MNPTVVTPLFRRSRFVKRGNPLMIITYGDVGGEPRAAAERQLLVHEVQVQRVLGGEGGHEAQPLAERHPDVRSARFHESRSVLFPGR